MTTPPILYTIGHSVRKSKEVIDKLLERQITVLVDVRSRPYSKYNPQFNRESFRDEITENGIQYVYRGRNLGGLDKNIKWDEAISELIVAANKGKRVCVMCSEGNPNDCHRKSKIEPAISSRGVYVHHILWTKPIVKKNSKNGNMQASLFK